MAGDNAEEINGCWYDTAWSAVEMDVPFSFKGELNVLNQLAGAHLKDKEILDRLCSFLDDLCGEGP
jgi:hypothetical protein